MSTWELIMALIYKYEKEQKTLLHRPMSERYAHLDFLITLLHTEAKYQEELAHKTDEQLPETD